MVKLLNFFTRIVNFVQQLCNGTSTKLEEPEYVKLQIMRQVHLPGGVQRHVDHIIIRNSYNYFKENKLVRALVYSILAKGGGFPKEALDRFRFEYGLVYSADNPFSGYLCIIYVLQPTPNELLLFTEE